MNIEEIADKACFQKNYEMLSLVRREKIDSYRLVRDKKLSLGVGILLNRGLSEYGLKEADVAIAYGKHGKPYLVNYPNIHFNLSHAGQMVLAIFAEVEVGCDIEPIQKAEMPLAKRFFCSEEYEYIATQTEEWQNRAFYRIWTLKESFIKATGLGLSLPLNVFEIQIGTDEMVNVRQTVDHADYQFFEYQMEDYCIAVCFREWNGE